MEMHGMDTGRAGDLAARLAGWSAKADPIVSLVAQAETLSDVSSGASVPLDQIASDGRAMAQAITTAIDLLTSFQINSFQVGSAQIGGATPFEALVLDIEIGSAFARDIGYEAMASGETYRQTQVRREIDRLRDLPSGPHSAIHAQQIARLWAEHTAIDPDQRGDRGGTLSVEVRDPFVSTGGTNGDLGLGVVAHALADTADGAQIQVDEFQTILHDNGKVTLVLPGVIDLTSPHLGYDSETRSARDTDQQAFRSLTSTDIADNAYARLVIEFFEEQVASGAIPKGSDVLIVGHSFGADTALDLAAHPKFNGELVNVTHVVPAAYHSEPQLQHVAGNTEVAVFQNIYDLPVIGEELGYAMLSGAPLPAIGGVPATEGIGRLAVEGGEAVVEGGAHVVNGGAWVLEQGTDFFTEFFGSRKVDIPEVPTHVEFIGDQVTPTSNGFIAEFEGGFAGGGHHQDNYVEYISDPEVDPLVASFLAELGEAGYGRSGVSLAVDVSMRGAALPDAPASPPPHIAIPQPVPGPDIVSIPPPDTATPAAVPPPIPVPPPPIPMRTPGPTTVRPS